MRQHNPTKRFIAALAGLALITAACGDDGDDEDVEAEDPGDDEEAAELDYDPETDRLVLGRVMAETGPLAFLGPPPIAGIQMAVEDINAAGGVLGEDVELLEADEGPEPTNGRDNVVDLLNQGANVIVGAMASGYSQEFIQILFDNQVPQCSPANTAPDFTTQDNAEYYFRTALPDEEVVDIFVDELVADGHERIAIAARADDYGEAYKGLMDDGLAAANLDIVYSETFSDDVATYDAEVDAILGSDADAVIFIAFNEGGELIRGLVEQDFDPANIYGSDGVFTPTLTEEVDETNPNVIDGMKLIGMGGTDEFNDRLSEETEGNLIYGAQAYDCGVIAALAAESAGTVDSTLTEHAIAVTNGEIECNSFEECKGHLDQDHEINYVGAAGGTALSDVGDPTQGTYAVAQFEDGELTPVNSYSVGVEE